MAGQTQTSKEPRKGRNGGGTGASANRQLVAAKAAVRTDQPFHLAPFPGTTSGGNCTSIPTIADLPSLSRAALGALWTRLFDRPVPKGLSPQLMNRFLAFEIQARAVGGLAAGFVETLAQRAGAASAMPKPAARLRPGGRLLREWNGVTHVVDVDADGFLWSGRQFGSLSAIAKEITGAHWSGPRFFGLTGGGAGGGGKVGVDSGGGAESSSGGGAAAKGKAGKAGGGRLGEPVSKRSFKAASNGASSQVPTSGASGTADARAAATARTRRRTAGVPA